MKELFKHQKEFLDLMPNKHLLCWEMGTAKTRTSIEWAKKIGKEPLIVVPKGLVQGWIRELDTWGLDNYTLITKEKFRSLASTLPKHDVIIIDEGHYFAGQSQMHKAMVLYARQHKPNHVTVLTGTPYLRSAWNVYRLGIILGTEEREDTRSFWNWQWFDRTFFNRVRMGGRVVPVPKQDKSSKDMLANCVDIIGSTKKLDECADVPESLEYKEMVEITKEQKRGVEDITDIEPLVRYTKQQQIMGGWTKADAYNPQEEFKSNKVERLKELVNQNEKIIVVCRYTHELYALEKILTKAGRTVFMLHGGVDERDTVVQEARQAEECVLLVGAQISEGWEAPEFDTMIFFSHSFSLKDYLQMKGRIQRINNLRSRCYAHLLVEDSIDEAVYASLMNKKDFLVHIYDKTRSQNNNPIT